MSKKNIVSIEDRIPKLKQARKKKANRRLIFYLSIFFFLISVIVYLQSPLSHIRNINVSGNSYIEDERIISYSNLGTNTNIWTIDHDKIEQLIEKDPIVKSVSVQRQLPWTVHIEVNEQNVIGYIKEDSSYHPILETGRIIDEPGYSYDGNAPLLYGFNDEEYLHKIAAELNELPENILNIISEVHWKPTEDNKNTIFFYMNDGFTVKGSLRDFADRMDVYPSIVSQLDPEEKGIIHVGVGVYFESFSDSADEEEGEGEAEESGEEG